MKKEGFSGKSEEFDEAWNRGRAIFMMKWAGPMSGAPLSRLIP
jgi:hypothetical protein